MCGRTTEEMNESSSGTLSTAFTAESLHQSCCVLVLRPLVAKFMRTWAVDLNVAPGTEPIPVKAAGRKLRNFHFLLLRKSTNQT